MTLTLCIGGPRDGEWIDWDLKGSAVLLYDVAAAHPWGDVEIAQHLYLRQQIGAGPALATRTDGREWSVLVHTSATEQQLAAWLASQERPVVDGPRPITPRVPCYRCPQAQSCWMGLCLETPPAA